MTLVIDFETKSRCDLKACGVDRYASDPSTDILCMAAIDTLTNQEWLWYPEDGALPAGVLARLKSECAVAAVNARFDQAIWEFVAVDKYGFPLVHPDRWLCISAQMRVRSLPSSLENAGMALGAKRKKSNKGLQLIRQLSIPQADGTFNNSVSLLREMGQYCLDDARASVDIMRAVPDMTVEQRRDWLVSERINDRGVKIDLELAHAAQKYAGVELDEIRAEVTQITNGVVTSPTQRQRVKDWIVARVDDDVLSVLTKYVDGEKKHTLEKDARARFFDGVDSGELTVPDDVYNLMACYDDSNKSSVAKFKRMTDMAMHDGRVRGAFVYGGASTLRFTSRGLQLHNFKRDCFSASDANLLRHQMLSGQKMGSVLDTLGKMLRPAIIPESGCSFVVNDWSGIENRMLPWLANDRRAQKKLDTFVEIDNDPTLPDMYVRAAESINSSDRQIGKVVELSLGFLGANGAFNSMARNYGVRLPEHEVTRIVKKWRSANPWAVDFGNALEAAAVRAVRTPDTTRRAGRVRYTFKQSKAGDAISGYLYCTLPSGTVITYADPRVKRNIKFNSWELSALKANFTPAKDATEWPRFNLWRGLLAENVTQAECATLLREVLYECEQTGIPVVLHCHDEVVAEVPDHMAESVARQLQVMMETPPAWAQGLPLKAEPTIVKRYGK